MYLLVEKRDKARIHGQFGTLWQARRFWNSYIVPNVAREIYTDFYATPDDFEIIERN